MARRVGLPLPTPLIGRGGSRGHGSSALIVSPAGGGNGGSGEAGDIYSNNFETPHGPFNDRFGLLEWGGAGGPRPLNLNLVQNASLAADSEWFAQSLNMRTEAPPAWYYPHNTYEGSHADHLYVRQRILFTNFCESGTVPGTGESPKTIRFFAPSNDNLGYVLIRGVGTQGPGTVEWHWSDPLPIESGGSFTLRIWHWIEVGLTGISDAAPRVRVWLDGELIIDATGPGASKGAISQTRFLWAGGGNSEDQPMPHDMYIRFDQIDFATSHMGVPDVDDPIANTLPHRTDFLTLPNGPGGSVWYPTRNSAERAEALDQSLDRGYTHLYLSITSNAHDYFGNPSGFLVFLNEILAAGLKPVVWLTSDTGAWKDQSIAAIKSDLDAFIPAIDHAVNSYCLGIEVNEYWTLTEATEIGGHLDTLTHRPLAIHMGPNGWTYAEPDWCDYLIYQYGFGQTEQEIRDETDARLIDLAGKPMVAGEYNLSGEATSIALGNAALERCAAGFGNGGTAGNVLWPTCI